MGLRIKCEKGSRVWRRDRSGVLYSYATKWIGGFSLNPTNAVSRPPDGPSAEPVRVSQSPHGAPTSPPEWPRAGAGVVRGPPGVGARSGVGGVGLDSAVVPQWAACLVLSVDPGRHGPFGSRLRL